MQEQDTQKIRDFVDHLLGLPNIKGEPLLIGEGLILNFIVQNMNQLKATFKTPQFFPHLDWNEVIQVMLSELYGKVSHDILPEFLEFINSADLHMLNLLHQGTNFPENFLREKLQEFTQTIFKNKDVRYNLSSTLNIFKYNILEKYLAEIFNRREVIYNELVRVQKMNLECDEYLVLLKTMLIIKNAAYLKMPINENSSTALSLTDALKMPGKASKFIEKAAKHLFTMLPVVPEKIIQLALKANLKESLTENEDASSRFLFIFSHRFHNYRPVEKIDRGAESPDKSWFAIARKNADLYGYDKRMLDALYRIAGDNNW